MKKTNLQSGFTLIELMVSVSIFAIVTVIVSGSFITLAGIYRQVQANRAIINNLNLAMDTMTLQVREGKGHNVDDDTISFREYVIDEDNKYTPKRFLSYELKQEILDDGKSIGVLQQCVGGECNALTSEEIDVDQLYFKQLKDDPKLILVVMKGEAINTKGIRSPFLLQTTLSQRNKDEI